MPKITVLMPVYNGEKYLHEAINSILKQTFTDYEFLIINDGSTDNSLEIIKSYNDARIKLENNENNQGLIYSLNKGIDLAQGEYIARMDADDISLPDRLKKQYEFMESRQDIAVCGTYTVTIGKMKGHINKFYTAPDDIKANLLFYTSLAHPSAMIRKKILKEFDLRYDVNFQHAEDYDLWERISNYASLANLPKILVKHRLHEGSISSTYSEIQFSNAKKVRRRQLEKLGIDFNDEELDLFSRLKIKNIDGIKEFIDQQEKRLLKIIEFNRKKNIYTPEALAQIIKHRLYYICDANTNLGFWVFKKYLNSPIRKLTSADNNSLLKLFIKVLFKK